MKTKETPFFIKLKNAILNFDEYKNFLEEETFTVIKYILKLLLVFTLVLTITLTCKVVQSVKNFTLEFENEFPEFSFENNILQIEGDNKKFVKGDENGIFGYIVDSTQEDINNIAEVSNYQNVVLVLKDKIIVKNSENVQASIGYNEIGQSYDLSSVNKETVLQYLSRK